jgi:hypothetical protein
MVRALFLTDGEWFGERDVRSDWVSLTSGAGRCQGARGA